MANPSRRGQVAGPVSGQMRGDAETPFANTSMILPYGLQLQQKVGMVDITNVTASGGTVTYTAANNYSAGNTVSISYVDPVAYNLKAVTIATASSTQFTVTNAATGTYVSGGIAQRTGEIAVTIPAGITFVYAIAVGGGGAGSSNAGGNAGAVSWGWTIATSSCVIATPAGITNAGGYTRYGNIIATGGGTASAAGPTNYWGIPGGATGVAPTRLGGTGSNAGGGGSSFTNGVAAGNGGAGISGGGGGQCITAGAGTNTGGSGGSGLAGGGGGRGANSTTLNIGGNGGNGINILTGAVTLGSAGTNGGVANGFGGGGGGLAGKGEDVIGSRAGDGGIGGGGGGNGGTGFGGAGILYLFY
jgi:hypothetical protein